ncbi:ROK family protein [Lichenifustis flavocetrariae]|uniref:ROK family protein n=1 Tax=Lichenifustis flavocetrariae TaxID=2949735 RepID=A0AA41YUB3_9HYPH|nr:ROK family protein [Lichenifustis flavocetrariae]MCW6507003.1 ROK family protein [Lichenifustis flavocetrariae]
MAARIAGAAGRLMRQALAVDLGGTELRAALVDETGRVQALAKTATDSAGGPDAVITQISALIDRVMAEIGLLRPLGLGIAAPGPLDPVAGIALAPPTLQGWHDVPLTALLQDRIGLPVRLENDANAAALGEWRFGAGRGTQNMVFVTVSTGIGGGVIADGRLLHGWRGLAAEVGHMTIALGSDKSVFGGATGAWEALASGTALGIEATRSMGAAEGARLRALAGWGPASSRHVVLAAREGDALATALLHREAHLLGVGFVNLMHLYAPERIVVGGGLGTALDLMDGEIARTVQTRALAPYRTTPIVPAALGHEAGLVGAASLILMES